MQKNIQEISNNKSGVLVFDKPKRLSMEGEEFPIEFRVAILPTKQNLNNALYSLRSFFHEQNLPYEILSLNGNETLDQLGWDSTFAQLNTNSKYDQRGGELCFKINCELEELKEGNILLDKNSEEIKDLILKIWQRLSDAGIVMGYVYPQAPYKPIKTKDGLLTAFSYGSKQEFKQKNKSTGYVLDPDTLKLDLDFSDKDLIQNGISIEDLRSLQVERMMYVQQHINQAKAKLIQEIKRLNEAKGNELPDVLNNLKLPVNDSDFPQFIQQNQHFLEEISSLVPRQFDAELSLRTELTNVITYWKKIPTSQNLAKDVKLLRLALNTLKEYSNRVNGENLKVNENIVKRYENDPYIMDLVVKSGSTNLKDLVERHPVQMQLLYRSFVHLQNEEKSFFEYKKTYDKEQNSVWRNHKGKILAFLTLAAGIVTAGLGAALTATGVLAPIGIPLTGVGLYAATVGTSAALGLLIAGVPAAITYCVKQTPQIDPVNRFFKEETLEMPTYGKFAKKGVFVGEDAKETLRNRPVGEKKDTPSQASTHKQTKTVDNKTYEQLEDNTGLKLEDLPPTVQVTA